MKLSEIREKYPQYNKLSDEDLLGKLHNKYYSSMPIDEFYSKVGYKKPELYPSDSYINQFSEALSKVPGVSRFAESVYPTTSAINNFMEQNIVPLAAHGAQGFLNTPASVANLVPGVNIPHLDYAKYTHLGREETFPEQVAEFIGGLGGLAKGAQLVGKGLSKLPNILGNSKYSKYLSNIFKTGTSGYATGESKGEEGQYLGSGRLMSAALGTAIPAIAGAPGAAKVFVDSLKTKMGYKPAKEIADQIAHMDKASLLKESSEMFKRPFQATKKAGITKSDIKKENAKDLFKAMDSAEREVVSKAFKTKNLEDIHDAYKEIGKFKEGLEYAEKVSGRLPAADRNALKAARKIQDNMKESLLSAFEKAGGKDLANSFVEANKHWEEKVTKNLYNKLLNKYREGDLLAKDLISDLYGNKLSRAHFSEHFPETYKDISKHVEVPKAIDAFKKYIAYGGAGGLGALGAGYGVKKLSEYLQ